MIEGVYHAEVLTVSRGDGRSAPGAIAYRAGIVIEDERTGEKFDYRRKRGIRHTEIVLPKEAPAQYADRSFLWNEVERVEKHPRATVAREIQIAIPAQLTHEHQLELVRRFVNALVHKHGFVIDFAIHDPDKNESNNVHAHIMMTTRRLTAEGFKGKTREWDEIKKLGPQTTKEMRKLWADFVNAAYHEACIDMFIDHRSHKQRGLKTTPTKKMGAKATAMERRGQTSERGDVNRAIQAANAAIEATKREHAIVQGQIDQLTKASVMQEPTPQTVTKQVVLTDQPKAAPVQVWELPMPHEWLHLSAVYEHILNGPDNSTVPTFGPVIPPEPQPTLGDQEREYRELQQLQAKVLEYFATQEAAAVGRNECEALKKQYDNMTPPRFSVVLKFIGFNEQYDDYLERKRDVNIAMKKKAQQVKELEDKQDKLKSARREWDEGGKALRFKRLAKELGSDRPQKTSGSAHTRVPHGPTLALDMDPRPLELVFNGYRRAH